jgi:hypothetical protein
MKRLATVLAVLVALFSITIFYSPSLTAVLTENIKIIKSLLSTNTSNNTTAVTTSVTSLTTTDTTSTPMNTAKTAMSKALRHAKISPHRSGTRGHSDHGWLNTYHSFCKFNRLP